MLKELSIRNLAIIETIHIEFPEGITAITGETGAGKSIILEAIDLLMGAKVHGDLIRSGCDKLEVEGVFELSGNLKRNFQALELDDDDELIVRREITKTKLNRVFINGRRSTNAVLKSLFDSVVEVIGQQGNHVIFDEKNHLAFLDELLSPEEKKVKQVFLSKFYELEQLNKVIKVLELGKKERENKYALYCYQIKELDKVNLNCDEAELLAERYTLLSHAEEIKKDLFSVADMAENDDINVITALQHMSKILAKNAPYSANLSTLSERLDSSLIELQDIFQEVSSINDSIDFDFDTLQTVSKRLDVITAIKVKYQKEIPELLAYLKEIKTFVDNDSAEGHDIEKRQKEKLELESTLYHLASDLTQYRKRAAKQLKATLIQELCDLNMPESRMDVQFQGYDTLKATGLEHISFLISTNKGEALKPMSEILSGGEGSRVILALKTLFSRQKIASMLIFDEIDMGVGGKTVEKMAESIKKIQAKQMLCITHSAQIAAIAKTHFFIEKQVKDEKTIVKLKAVEGEEKVAEIARMIAGNDISEAVKKHAKELLGKHQ